MITSSPSSADRASQMWRRSSLCLLCIVVLVALFTVGDYGRSWDETYRFQGGDTKLDYYKALFSGESPKSLRDSYPGLFDLPLAWVHEQFPEWGTRSQKGHVWSVCFGLLGLLSAWRLTARIGGERAGFWALLLLATLPRYYGHMFFNPKDIPLAATYTLGLWALVHLFTALPEVSRRSVVWIGLAAGLALSTRIAGFLILFYFGAGIGLYLLFRYLWDGRDLSVLKRELWQWGLRGLGAGLLAFCILFIFWPTLHDNPFREVSQSVSQVQNYSWEAPVLVNGAVHLSTDLPRSYLPYWMVRTLPEHILLLLVLSLCFGIWQIYRSPKSWGRWLAPGLVLFSGVFPVLYIVCRAPVLYDGMRHALFVLPPLVCVAALGLEWCVRRMSGTRAKGLQLAVGLAVGMTLLQMVSLHPYQYVYFNQITGGLRSAYMHDETDYWGLSHKEAGQWLNSWADDSRVYSVHLRYNRYMLKEHLDPERFVLTPDPDGADFFVAVTRFGFFDDYPDAQLLHVVERQGVPLCFVFALSHEIKEKLR